MKIPNSFKKYLELLEKVIPGQLENVNEANRKVVPLNMKSERIHCRELTANYKTIRGVIVLDLF